MSEEGPTVAIVDYGMGNLFSVQRACTKVGLRTTITSSRDVISSADGVILPGVGAFGGAMDTLRDLDLVDTLRDAAALGRPFFGVCLGQQLLATESLEFGRHAGLDIIPGRVVRFAKPVDAAGRPLKVPLVAWMPIRRSPRTSHDPWHDSPLQGLPDGEHMYFVHSYYVEPRDPSVILATTNYGNVEFCSALGRDNIFACQFHPERSGPRGLAIYRSFAMRVKAAASAKARQEAHP